MKKYFIIMSTVCLMIPVSSALSESSCIKVKGKIVNGKVKSKILSQATDGTGACPTNFTKVVTAETTPPAIPEDTTVAFAKTKTAGAPTISNFGGSRATSASVERAATGFYVVSFTGSFDSTDTFARLGVLCTGVAGNICAAFVSNDTTTSGTANKIEIGVLTYDEATGAAADSEVQLSVIKGNEP